MPLVQRGLRVAAAGDVVSGLAVAFLLFLGPPALLELGECAVVRAARRYPSLNRFLEGDS